MQAFDAIPNELGPDVSDHAKQTGESLLKEGNNKSISSITNQIDVNASKKLFAGDKYINFAKDSKGNFVTKNRWGQLLTRDERGRMVDYEHHIENQRMRGKDGIALTSILFCNPMMLFGLGATFAFMDQFHQSNKHKEIGRLKNQLDGKKTGKQTKGYDSSKDTARTLGLIYDKRPNSMEPDNVLNFEEEMKKRARRKKLEQSERRQSVANNHVDKRALSRQNLKKMKLRLEEQLEHMRGVADHAHVAKVEAQIEKLDKALKRFSALGT